MPDNRTGYASYTGLDSISYECIKYLMNNNEIIWKLLANMKPDAWTESDLTKAEKAALIYDGSEDATKFNVFIDDGVPDVYTREDAILRISPFSIFPENRTIATVMVRFEVYAHWKANHLTNYKTRVDMITQSLLETMNGVEINSLIGRLHFDRLASSNARLETTGQSPFKGKVFYMGNKIS